MKAEKEMPRNWFSTVKPENNFSFSFTGQR